MKSPLYDPLLVASFLLSLQILCLESLAFSQNSQTEAKVSDKFVFRSAVGDTIIISPKGNPEKKIFLRKGQSHAGLELKRSTGKSAVFVDKNSGQREVIVQYAQMDEAPAAKGAAAKPKYSASPGYDDYDQDFEEFDDDDFEPLSGNPQEYEAPPPPPIRESWDRRERSSMTGPSSESSPQLAPLSDEEIDELLLGDESIPPAVQNSLRPTAPEGNTAPNMAPAPDPKMPKPRSILKSMDPKPSRRLDDPHGGGR